MQIGVYGCGYLGTVVAACLADFGVPVTAYGSDSVNTTLLASGILPFHEKNLSDIVRRGVRSGRLMYSTHLQSMVQRAEIIYLAEDANRDMEAISMEIANYCDHGQILVLVTPVPVGTAQRIEERLKASGRNITVVSHPLFLSEGCAVEDFNWPDRIVLGTNSNAAVTSLKALYRPLVMRGVPVIVTSHQTAELVREASTAFLATKVSFINELSSLCERINADAVDLSLALGLDKRIAPRSLQPGSLGGSFTESDMDSLANLAAGSGVSLKILSAAREVNQEFCARIMRKISGAMGTVEGKQVGLLGLAFKPNTNSVVSSGSIRLARSLMESGAHVKAYDPIAMPDAQQELTGNVRYCDSAYSVAEGADALVLGTGWPEFRTLDFDRIRRIIRNPVVVDTKNLLDGPRMKALGFEYLGVGRGA
ncbi:MAG TPA: nucleotide sugar dehydrogenase [Candidatus Angelobacter sp.]|jgi:UDPglucose 6-dehydrogenase|nr:nucleotide sugar dehydrogenase [Candidatus Angelobacter sp.]HZE81600.1 nucleotide sugar dehydrogenase [Candidatus Polarisedimenticolia bacterium]